MSTDFMSLHRPGIGNAASYQVSGIPWVSSSLAVPASGSTPLEITFPQVTKSLIVKNANETGMLGEIIHKRMLLQP